MKPGGARFDLYVGFRSRLPTYMVYCNQLFVGGVYTPRLGQLRYTKLRVGINPTPASKAKPFGSSEELFSY